MNPGLLTIAQPHFYESEEQPYVFNSIHTFQLPLPRFPHGLRVVLVCKNPDLGYIPGCEIDAVNLASHGTGGSGLTVNSFAGSVEVIMSSNLSVKQRSNPAALALGLTLTNFTIKLYCTFPPLA